jgi:hypothetical protein
MISCGETGAGVSVACTGPASFDLANVAIDQTAVVATMTATTAKIMILRISCHPFQRGELMIALAHRPQLEGEGRHTGRFFAIARSYRARRRYWAVLLGPPWAGVFCADCIKSGRPKVADWYVVKKSVWQRAWPGTSMRNAHEPMPMKHFLCIPCLEKRIGRRLTRRDFDMRRLHNYPEHNLRMSRLFRSRLKNGARK